MPSYHNGPLDGQVGYQPGMDPSPEQLAQGAVPDPQQGGDAGGDPMAALMGGQAGPQDAGPAAGGDAKSKFDTIMAGVMDLAMSDGQVSESEKLIMQQIGTLLQKLKTDRQKQTADAIQGSPTSPAVGQAYA